MFCVNLNDLNGRVGPAEWMRQTRWVSKDFEAAEVSHCLHLLLGEARVLVLRAHRHLWSWNFTVGFGRDERRKRASRRTERSDATSKGIGTGSVALCTSTPPTVDVLVARPVPSSRPRDQGSITFSAPDQKLLG